MKITIEVSSGAHGEDKTRLVFEQLNEPHQCNRYTLIAGDDDKRGKEFFQECDPMTIVLGKRLFFISLAALLTSLPGKMTYDDARGTINATWTLASGKVIGGEVVALEM